jgi:Predicted permease, DMT superfamily
LKNVKALYITGFISVTIIWGMSFLFVSDVVRQGIPIFLLLALRFMLGMIPLFIFRWVKRIPKITKDEWLKGMLAGLAVFVAFIFQTYGALYTTSAKNGLLTGLYVIFVPLICFRSVKSTKPFCDAVVCILGMAFLFNVFSGMATVNIGDIFTILCAIAFAVQFILIEKHVPKLNPVNYTITQLVTVSIAAIIVSFMFEAKDYVNIVWTYSAVLKIVWLGVLSTGYAYIMQTLVQTKLSAATVSIIACLESVFAMSFSLLFGYESFSANLMIGFALIMIAMVSSVISPTWKNKQKC